jgi:MFS family permease
MRKRDLSGLLIYAALGVTVPRYIGAFVASDVGHITGWMSDALTALMVISGVGMGVLDIVGMAYVFDGWRSKLPKTGERWGSRFRVLTAFVVGLAVCGVGILTPFTLARVQGAGIADVLRGPWLVVWAVLVNLAPLFLVGGVIGGQSGVVTVTHSEPQERAPEAHHAPKPAHTCAQCGAQFATSAQYAAHVRWKHSKK